MTCKGTAAQGRPIVVARRSRRRSPGRGLRDRRESTSTPSRPWRMASGMPATRVATTGTPAAIASSTTIGRPSPNRLGNTNRSICRSSLGHVAGEARPGDVRRPVRVAARGRRFRPRSVGDSNAPTARKCTCTPCRRSIAIASKQDLDPFPRPEQGHDAERPASAGLRHDRAAPAIRARRWARRESAPDRSLPARCARPWLAKRQSPAMRAAGSAAR